MVMDEFRKVVIGFIITKRNYKYSKDETDHIFEKPEIKEDMTLSSEDIYQLMYERDYFYCDKFRSIYKANPSLTKAHIVWNNNWVTFLDGILQLSALRHAHDTVSQPNQIRRLCIDIDEHSEENTVQVDGNTVMKAEIIELSGLARCGGVKMEDIKFHGLPTFNDQAIGIRTLKFVPRFQSNTDTQIVLQINLQMVTENINKEWIKVYNIVSTDKVSKDSDEIETILADIHGLTVSYERVPREQLLETPYRFFADVDLILVHDLSSDESLCQMLFRVLQRNTFIVNMGTTDERKQPTDLYSVVSSQKLNRTTWELLRWRPIQTTADSIIITVQVQSDLGLLRETRANLPQSHKLVVHSSYPPVSGLKDLVKKWRKETDRNQIYLIMMSMKDNIVPVPELDLAFNIFDKGVWEGEYYIPWQQISAVEQGMALRIRQIGDLDALQWVEAPELAGSGIPVKTIKATFIPGMSVLVHGGTGALGQAAIAIALAHDSNVFTTVSDVNKKRFLMKMFPQLKENHIGNSRDTTFGDMVMMETNGKGCIIIICCVKGELKNTSLKCGSMSSVILDTVQLPQREKFAFGINHLTGEKNYPPVDFTSIFTDENVEEMRRLQMFISEGIARGYVRPNITYAPNEISRSFRLVAASRHRGRAVIRLRESVEVTQSRVFFSSNLYQLVLCDEGAFGVKLADRLITRGAIKLHLNCGHISTYLRFKIKSWENLGVKVEVTSEDLSNANSVVLLMNKINRLEHVEGVYFVVTFSSANVDNVEPVDSHFDLASRSFCPYLRYFAVVTAGNTIGEATCLSRVREGLPATMINLLQLSKAGNTYDSKEVLSWRSAFDAIERGLRSSQAAVLAYIRSLPSQTLLQQVAAIGELRISDKTVCSSTLLDLGIELTKVPAICSFLQDIHNFSLQEEHIPNLTVQQIYELEEMMSGSEWKEVRGLETFFSYVDPDELLATTEIVFLSSLSSSVNMVNIKINRITCKLYDAKTEQATANEVRKDLFSSKNKLVTSLPPTSAALEQHALRAAFQAGHIWGNALNLDVSIPDPSFWGWKDVEGKWLPHWSKVSCIWPELSLLDHCGCKSGGDTMRCGCRRVGLACTLQCKGQCQNKTENHIDIDIDE